ncbi:DUF6114 domain-containing protein [Kitasatospora sp. RB6PN24]|uniref:DUF6114 domain-containing protein n=1 Tax=Kitasatospora humi TaxID=2893891 RepID=UPI001E5ADA38|nr:DUF6114 domain-containing protein [Kitasatospora humi]MCC9306938.1 DUF6114 domain-containing protein [Kitasatospora humi]
MTTATANQQLDGAGRSVPLGVRFRAWRRSRPFWGGMVAVLAGLPILYFPYAHLSLGGLSIAMSTTAGAGSLVIGLLLMLLGVAAWFQPMSRVFCGVGVTILTLISLPVSNLGGFGLGLILGLIGGGLLCAWTPLTEEQLAALAEAEAVRRPIEAQLGSRWAGGDTAPAGLAQSVAAGEAAGEQADGAPAESAATGAAQAEQAGADE